MQDNWKELFSQHKDMLHENFELPTGHENRFLAKLNQTSNKVVPPKFNYWKAAAILIPLLMVSAYFLMEFQTTSTSQNKSLDLAMYSAELSEAENQLSFIIEEKMNEVKAMETPENQSMVDESLSNLEALQTDYNRLLADVKQSGGNPQVIKSVLLNLQLQVEVMENVLAQLNSIQEFKLNKNETNL